MSDFADAMREAVREANKKEQVLCCAHHGDVLRPVAIEGMTGIWACPQVASTMPCQTAVVWKELA